MFAVKNDSQYFSRKDKATTATFLQWSLQ